MRCVRASKRPASNTSPGPTRAPGDEGERDRLTEAKEFLRDVLRAGPVWGKQIKKEATEADIAWRTVERAKTELKVQTYKDGESGKWMWILPGPPEDGDETRRSSPRHPDDGGHGGHGGHGPSSPTPPTLADMADMASTTTTTTEKRLYLSELRQLRQLRQLPATTDEATTSPTPPTPPTLAGTTMIASANSVTWGSSRVDPIEIVFAARALSVRLSVTKDDRIEYRPRSAMPDELLAEIKANREALLFDVLLSDALRYVLVAHHVEGAAPGSALDAHQDEIDAAYLARNWPAYRAAIRAFVRAGLYLPAASSSSPTPVMEGALA
jgi:hypothetical protein